MGGGLLPKPPQSMFPHKPLSQSLKDVAQQTGANILFAPDAVRACALRPSKGSMSAQDAVERLIAGTNLEVVPDGSGGLIVRSKTAAAACAEAAAPAAPSRKCPKERRSSSPASADRCRETWTSSATRSVWSTPSPWKTSASSRTSNLATAMMRIPGVTVNRGVTSMDGIDSTTGDPSEITVRGFGPTFNETLFDGRKISSGVSNRALRFQRPDVGPRAARSKC